MGTDTTLQGNEEAELDKQMGEPEVDGVAFGENETILHELRPAWTNYTRKLIIGTLTAPLLYGFIPLARAWKGRQSTRYIITNERIIMLEEPLFGGASTEQYELGNVERIETEQSKLERQFGVGTVTVHMRRAHHQSDQFDLTLPSIPDYQQVAQSLRQ